MKLDWKLYDWNQIDTAILYTILALRSEVFVVEQDCVYQDIDGKDAKANHLLGYENDQLIAYSRLFKPGDYFDHLISILAQKAEILEKVENCPDLRN